RLLKRPHSAFPSLADPSKRPHKKQSPYTVDRGMPGAYEGETVTRRRLFTGGALAAGGIASAAFGLPALGFAVGPLFEKTEAANFQDVGPEADFNPETYVAKVITLAPDAGEPGKATVYVRKFDPTRDTDKLKQPYVAISNRCMHLGCPVRYVQASERSSARATAGSTSSTARWPAVRRCARSTASTRRSKAAG